MEAYITARLADLGHGSAEQQGFTYKKINMDKTEPVLLQESADSIVVEPRWKKDEAFLLLLFDAFISVCVLPEVCLITTHPVHLQTRLTWDSPVETRVFVCHIEFIPWTMIMLHLIVVMLLLS